jgi:hypothetical protein
MNAKNENLSKDRSPVCGYSGNGKAEAIERRHFGLYGKRYEKAR